MNRPFPPMKIELRIWLCCGVLFASGGALAQIGSKGTSPADPTNMDNQMIISCMEQQDPALKKSDAIELCKKKLKQGIEIGRKPKPKPKHKPPEAQPPPAPAAE